MPPILASFGASSIKSFGLTAFRAVQALVTSPFNLTSLLLKTSVTNGAQNNTILDSSGSNFTITRNGNLTQGTFTPFSQPPGYWSNYFNRHAVSVTSVTAAGTGDFTYEGYIYPTVFDTLLNVWDHRSGGAHTSGMYFALNSTGNLLIYNVTPSTNSVQLNRWNHIAFVRSSGTLTYYINGISSGSQSFTRNCTDTPFYIGNGNDSPTGTGGFIGYISNMRYATSAVYTSDFTPATLPFGITSGGQVPPTGTNTKILGCQFNRFLYTDSANVVQTFTVSGTPTVEAFSPFLPTAAYDAAVVGGSAYFDGTADSLNFQDTTQSGTSSDFNIGASNNASVDYWFYLQQASYSAGFNKQVFAPTDWNGQIWYQHNLYDSGNISVFWRGGNNFSYYYTALPSAYLNQWNHLAFASDTSNNLSLFLNGTRILTTVTTIGLNSTTPNYITWGQQAAGQTQGAFKGYMSGLRFIQGSGAFNAASSSITVPTAPPTNTATTKLLLNMTNAGIFDSTGKNDIETVGNAQVSTTQAKFGPTAAYFDGTGDNLKLKLTNAIGSGDYTIEGFFYATASGIQYLFDIRESSQYIGAYIVGSSTTLYVNFGTTLDITASSSFALNTWNHLAFVRSGSGSNNTSVYLNGLRVHQRTDTTNYSIIPTLFVACENSGNYYLTGYIDEFRITKGYAVYTSNFSPPTAAFSLK